LFLTTFQIVIFPFFFILSLPAFQHAILIGSNQGNLASFAQIFSVYGQSNTVAKSGVGIGKEIFVGDVLNECARIKNPVGFNFVKEFFFNCWIRKKQFNQFSIGFPGAVNNLRFNQFSFIVNKARISFKKFSKLFIKRSVHRKFSVFYCQFIFIFYRSHPPGCNCRHPNVNL